MSGEQVSILCRESQGSKCPTLSVFIFLNAIYTVYSIYSHCPTFLFFIFSVLSIFSSWVKQKKMVGVVKIHLETYRKYQYRSCLLIKPQSLWNNFIWTCLLLKAFPGCYLNIYCFGQSNTKDLGFPPLHLTYPNYLPESKEEYSPWQFHVNTTSTLLISSKCLRENWIITEVAQVCIMHC